MNAELPQDENWSVENGVVKPQTPDLSLRAKRTTPSEFTFMQGLLKQGGQHPGIITRDTRTGIVRASLPGGLLWEKGHPVNQQRITAVGVPQEMRADRLALRRQELEALGLDLTDIDPRLVTTPSVAAYWTGAQWVRDLRSNPNPTTGLAYEQRKGPHQGVDFLRLEDAKQSDFAAVVALQEKHGRAVSATTELHPYGTYVGEGLTADGRLQGYGLEGETAQAIKVEEVGLSTLSRRPEKPNLKLAGLNFIHTHNMGIAFYQNGQWGPSHIVPSGEIATNLADAAGVQYAQAVFEGGVGTALEKGLPEEEAAQLALQEAIASDPDFIPVDVDEEGNVSIFALDQHAERFYQSCLSMEIPPPDKEQFKQTIIETVRMNKAYIPKNGGRLYIRPFVAGIGKGGGAAPAKEYVFGVSVFPFADYYKAGDSMKVEVRKDIHRPDTGADKAARNYPQLFSEKIAAKQRGFNDILSVDENGNVEEFGASAVIFWQQKDDGNFKLIAPKTRNEEEDPAMRKKRNILDSINRKTVIEMAREMGIEVEIRDVHYSEIEQMDGAFCAGTAAGIVPIALMQIKNDAEDEGTPNQFNNADAIALTRQYNEYIQQARRGQLTESKLAKFNALATLV